MFGRAEPEQKSNHDHDLPFLIRIHEEESNINSRHGTTLVTICFSFLLYIKTNKMYNNEISSFKIVISIHSYNASSTTPSTLG